MAQGIGGGTRIGESLATFNRWHAQRVINSRTAVMIVSDGYDTGEPERLGEEMRRLRRRCRKIVWLNPLIGWRDYSPQARGMQAALPYVDLFAPAHNLESLAALEPYPGEDLTMARAPDILEIISTRKAAGEPFALATVVRTVAATAAKAGAKAVILPDGTISEGWIGGGCARAAVLKAAKEALADGRSRLVSVPPRRPARRSRRQGRRGEGGRAFRQQYVPEPGHHGHLRRAGPAAAASRHLRFEPGRRRCRRPGQAHGLCRHRLRAGGRAAGHSPKPIAGSKAMRFRSRKAARATSWSRRRGAATRPRSLPRSPSMSTTSPLSAAAKKPRRSRPTLAKCGVAAERLAKLKAPAGLDLGAITPDEIAISIVAEIIAVKRSKGSRGVAQPSSPA